MRSTRALLAAGLIAGLIPASAAHAEWYVGADGGIQWLQDSDVDGGGLSRDTDYDAGPVVLGQAGYRFDSGLSLEGELGWRGNDVDSVSGLSAGGDVNTWSLMANAIYDFNRAGPFHPFLGAGIGAAHHDSDATVGGVSAYSGDEWAFAYQAFAGVGYDLNDTWSLKAQYRYFGTADYDVTTPAGTGLEAEYDSHAVLIGFTVRFGAPAPAPQPAPAAAPAPVKVEQPAPAVKRSYLVFFDWDRSTITPEAQAIIDAAAAAARQGTPARIDLTGHADRSGTDAYNMKLSMRRAEAVKQALMAQGVAARDIVLTAKGESTPLVATPDGVREPQNRRVEIVLP